MWFKRWKRCSAVTTQFHKSREFFHRSIPQLAFKTFISTPQSHLVSFIVHQVSIFPANPSRVHFSRPLSLPPTSGQAVSVRALFRHRIPPNSPRARSKRCQWQLECRRLSRLMPHTPSLRLVRTKSEIATRYVLLECKYCEYTIYGSLIFERIRNKSYK